MSARQNNRIKALRFYRKNLRPATFEKRVTNMLYPQIFNSLREAMNKIENNVKQSDTNKSLDEARIKKLKELFQAQSLLDELELLIEKKNKHIIDLRILWMTNVRGAHNPEDMIRKANKDLFELKQYQQLVMSDEPIPVSADGPDGVDDEEEEEKNPYGDADDADDAAQIRNASPTTTTGGRKLRTKKRKIHKKKSKVHKKKSKVHKKKSKVHKKKSKKIYGDK
jgi:hypothetical protein